MPARDYGRYLSIKYEYEIKALLESYNIFARDKDIDTLCAALFHDFWRSAGIVIDHDMELEVKFKNKLLFILYQNANIYKPSKTSSNRWRREK